MTSIYVDTIKTSVGDIVIGEFSQKLCLMDFAFRKMRKPVDDRLKRFFKADFVEKRTHLLAEAERQLHEYLAGDRVDFDIELALAGTDFQCKVWAALQQVPYGKTASYKDLAASIGDPSSTRAVANANGANAIAFIVPCHRIIGADGSLVGYGGGLPAKKKLLKLEASIAQIEMF